LFVNYRLILLCERRFDKIKNNNAICFCLTISFYICYFDINENIFYGENYERRKIYNAKC